MGDQCASSSSPVTLLGSLDGIEAGLRQLHRKVPVEIEEVRVDGRLLRVPTLPEILRIKSYLVVQRNQVRGYLDVVALADRLEEVAVETLLSIDDYYADRSDAGDSVLTVLVQRLAKPAPRDARVTRQLASYKGLDVHWHDWQTVVEACNGLADELLRRTAS